MNAPAKNTGVAIDPVLLARAQANGIDVTHMSEGDVYMAVRRLPDPRSPEEKLAANQRWAEENRAAMEASNRWVEEHGLPLARYRRF